MSEGMFLSSEISMKLDKVIAQLRQKLHPNCIILADISGQLLASYISNNEIDATGLAALFASNVGATSAIADKIQETEGFNFILHEGKSYNIFLSKIGNSYLMAVVFMRSEQIGIVRLFSKKASEQLLLLSREYEELNDTAIKNKIGNKFSEKLVDNLTDIFDDI